MAHVSGWLEGRELGAGELTAARVEQYLVYRRACGHVRRCSPRALAPLLANLRGLGLAPPTTPALALTATDRLLAEYAEYRRRRSHRGVGALTHGTRGAAVRTAPMALGGPWGTETS